MDEQSDYKDFVERLVLNNKIQYSDVPYQLRVKNICLFYYAVRVARDGLEDAAQFVSVLEQFLQDIDQNEKENGVDVRLRRHALNAISGVENLFKGNQVFDEFMQQQKRTRKWLSACREEDLIT